MSFVTVRNLFKYYDRRPILENIDLEVDEGSFVSLVGASGCGKSTFLRMLLAQELPSRGEIRVAGAEPDRARQPRGGTSAGRKPGRPPVGQTPGGD